MSEDIVAGRSKPEASDLVTKAPDDTTLEQVIGDLQSEWDVPNSPQEFRITIKIADKERSRPPTDGNGRGGNGRRPATKEEGSEGAERPKREKAPAAPRIDAGVGDDADGATPKRRKRSRRRRRRKGGSGAS